MMNIALTRPRAVLTAAAVAVAIGGCGGGEAATTTTTAATITTTSTPATSTSTSTSSTTTSTTTSTVAPTTTLDPIGAIAQAPTCTPIEPIGDEIYIPLSFVDGETRLLEVETRTEVEPAAVENDLVGVTPVTLTASSLFDGWSLRWENDPTAVLGADFLSQAFVDQIPPIGVEYTMGPDGLITSIDNVDELRASLDEVFDLLAALDDAAALGEVREVFAAMDDDVLGGLLTEEVQVYHYFDGVFLPVNDVLQFDDLLPNNFGGAPFPAVTAFWVEELADADGCLRVASETAFDVEAGAQILEDSIAQVFGADTEGVFDGFEIVNRADAVLDGTTGRVVRVEVSQSFRTDAESRVETVTITDVSAG